MRMQASAEEHKAEAQQLAAELEHISKRKSELDAQLAHAQATAQQQELSQEQAKQRHAAELQVLFDMHALFQEPAMGETGAHAVRSAQEVDLGAMWRRSCARPRTSRKPDQAQRWRAQKTGHGCGPFALLHAGMCP
jgi:hypothetical protein